MRFNKLSRPPEPLLSIGETASKITFGLEVDSGQRSLSSLLTRVKACAPNNQIEESVTDFLRTNDLWLKNNYILLFLNPNGEVVSFKSSRISAGSGCWQDAVYNLIPYLYLENINLHLIVAFITRAEYAIFNYQDHRLSIIEENQSDVPKKIKGGGWLGFEENRIRRHTDEHVREHLEHAFNRIEELMDDGEADGLVLAHPAEMKKMIGAVMRHSLKEKYLFALEGIDLYSPKEMEQMLLQKLKELREEEIKKMIIEAESSNRLVRDRATVLEMLNMGNIGKLILPLKTSDEKAYLCSKDLMISAAHESCPVCVKQMDRRGNVNLLLAVTAIKKGIDVHITEKQSLAAVTLFDLT